MKRKSSSTPVVSDEEEYKDISPVSVEKEMMGVESITGISSSMSFDDGEIDQKLASIHIPKAEETIKGKSSFTLFGSEITFPDPKGIKEKSSFTSFGSEEKISDSTFIKPKAEPIEGKPSSTFFHPEGKISDFSFFQPKAVGSMKGKSSPTYSGSGGKIPESNFIGSKSIESIKGKSSSTFFGPEGKGPDVTFSKPKGAESMKQKKSSASSSGSYDVVMDFDNTQYKKKGLELTERLHELLKSFEIYISEPDNIDVLEVGVTGKVFIPVFSNGFASSESCLRNLASMVDCRNYSDTNHIIPVYFGVEPSDVGLDTPLYQQDLDKLRRYVDDMVVNRWIEALIDVSNSSGHFVVPETAGPDEIDHLMKGVCQMVLHKLRLSRLSKGRWLFGLNQHVESIVDKLNLEINDVKAIVISTKDEAGRITLARAVYDKLSSSFEGCSFLASIDKTWWNSDGLQNLKAKLVSDLLSRKVEVFQSEEDWTDLIRGRFCHMKVLIVLDSLWRRGDVEALVGPLNWLGPGSRIVITTIGEYGLVPGKLSIDLLSHQLRLSNEEIFDIFNCHAFPKSYPFPNFSVVSQEISKAVSRHGDFSYLDIEIIGSLLYGNSDKAEWESMLLYLGQQDDTFFNDHRGSLRMSYDSLTEKQKQIFLEVSCLPDGMNRQIALHLWDGYSPDSQSYHDFEVLLRLSLVKIDANDRIWMHTTVRYFGREIMRYILPWGMGRADLVDMSSMRFFKMSRESGNPFERDYGKLRGLVYESQFPSLVEYERHTKCLKVLDLSWSKITEKWETWRQIQTPQLRVLNLTGCVGLMVTPNFSFCPDLEMLILEYCSQLVKIDPSIQALKRLTTLNLRYCTELCVLPKEMGCLNSLKELLMDGTSIQDIPVSIGHLKKLQILTAINCRSLTQLPDSICNLLLLTTLKLDGANIAELPRSILRRLKLQYLSLRDCRHITNLGTFVGEVERSLIELDVSGTSISELPKSISKLKNLRVLKVDFCFIREFPPGFGELKNLEEVHASWCRGLENLPHDIGEIKSLRILRVGHSRISSLPKSIQFLDHLEALDFTSCNKLQGLPELPSSLISLQVQSKEFKALPDLQNLVNLKEFSLGNDSIIINRFDWLKSSNSLGTLALCLPHTEKLAGFPACLRELTLQCTNLKHIPSLPSKLVSMSIQNFRLLQKFPSVRRLAKMQEMEVVCCPKIKEMKGLERLTNLQILTISECGIEQLDGLRQLLSLRRLTLQDCRSLSELPTVEQLTKLLEMKIIGCSGIERIVGLARLRSLEILTISNCGIRSLNELDELNSLRRLTITDCDALRQVPNLSNLRNLDEKCVLLKDPEGRLQK